MNILHGCMKKDFIDHACIKKYWKNLKNNAKQNKAATADLIPSPATENSKSVQRRGKNSAEASAKNSIISIFTSLPEATWGEIEAGESFHEAAQAHEEVMRWAQMQAMQEIDD